MTTLINTRQDWCVYWALWTNLHRMLLNPVMWTPHWEPLTHPWWIGQGEAGHWIAYRILSSYLSQQASISLILDSLYLIVKPTNWPLFVTVFNFFFSKTNKNFIKALHNSFYYSKMYQFTKPTYSYFTLLHYLMILPPYWASQIWWHWPFRSNGKFFFRFKSLKIIYDNVMNRFDLYVTYMNS